MRRMRASVLVAGGLAAAAAAWVASGQIGGTGAGAPEPGAAPPAAPVASVRVREAFAAQRRRWVSISGRTEASRHVVVRAETGGPVARVALSDGDRAVAGDLIARQDAEDRRARLAEARALVRQRRIEFDASTRLGEKGFRSETRIAESHARLESAVAREEVIRVDIDRTAVRAPFEGVIEGSRVEIGTYLRPGDPVASLVDLDPVLAVGSVSERQVSHVRPGMLGTVRTVGGDEVRGTVRFVASVADPVTRSFRVEMEAANPGGAIRAGLTVEMVLELPPARAYLIPPSVLTLETDGRIGVRVVDPSDVVRFVPVAVAGDAVDGIWVSGLADGMRVITVGHEFVKAGQRVRAVMESAETAS